MDRQSTTSDINPLEQFCCDHGFLYHARGSGKWCASPYWTYYKVQNNDRIVCSIEYFPMRNFIKISCDNNKFQGTPESLDHLLELLSSMRIDVEDINSK